MILKQQFLDKFNELLASMNRSMNSEYKTIWHRKVEELDYDVFVKTVDYLVMTSHRDFPTMPAFFSIYRQKEAAARGKEERGCPWCINGNVLYDRNVRHYGVVSFAVPCSHCNPRPGHYDAKRNRRGYKLTYSIGEPEQTESDKDQAYSHYKYEDVQAMVAKIGSKMPAEPSEALQAEEKRKQIREALFREYEVETCTPEPENPNAEDDEVPF